MTKIFISYRRDDSADFAGRVYERLAREVGRNSLFMDIDGTIPYGLDFAKEIDKRVGKCHVLLAIIGPNWLDARLDDPKDFVRIEIASALKRRIPVVPVLSHGAPMPTSDQLPVDLKSLPSRQGLHVRRESFPSDMNILVEQLKKGGSGWATLFFKVIIGLILFYLLLNFLGQLGHR
jgi:hypothetical protein